MTGDIIRDVIAAVNARMSAEEPEPEMTAEPEPTPAAPVGVGSAQPIAVGAPVELGELVGGGAPPIPGEGVYDTARRREVVDRVFHNGVVQEPFQGVTGQAGGYDNTTWKAAPILRSVPQAQADVLVVSVVDAARAATAVSGGGSACAPRRGASATENGQMSYMHNPVQRLHLVVSKLREYPTERTVASNQNRPVLVREAIKGSFLAEDAEDAEVLRLVAKILAMPGEAEAALRRNLDGPKLEAHLGWQSPVVNAVSQLASISAKHSRFVESVPEGTIKELQLAMFEIPDEYGDPHATTVEEAVHAVNELADSIAGADLDEELKRFLLDHLDRMRVALQEYRIRGASGIYESTDAALGAIYRAIRVHSEWFGPDDESKSTVGKFLTVLSTVADVGGALSLGIMALPWVQAALPG